ncbi:hypothetical protein GGS24DRAFT_501119 [Hypoxylon argillaceum]|nr:hypothetical protein GGS24DRAFT_501119 [Hypoxylon argillaceum]
MPPKNSNDSSAVGALGRPANAGEQRIDLLKEDGTTTSASSGKPDHEDHEEPQVKKEKLVLDALHDALLNDALLHNGEEEIRAAEKKARHSQYSVLGRDIFTIEQKRGIIERRTMQATIHTAFTEMRLQDLEKEFRQMKMDLYKLPADFEIKKPKPQHPIFLHVLHRSTMDKFESREMTKIPFRDRPALEVLVIEQLAGSEVHVESNSPSLGANTAPPATYLAPKRLRIRSRPLLAHLQQVTRMTISHELSPPDDELVQTSIVFLKPFKLLVTYEKEIRQSLPDLEKIIKDLSSEEKSVPPKNNIQKTFNDEDLLLDLKLLINFMDEDLKPVFDLRRKIKDGTAASIEYEDLWHLFQCGDIVLVASNRSHAYRVLNFTGGRDILIDRIERAQAPPPVLDGFTFDCLSIKFDGSDYIPLLEKFSIRPFSGSRPITSLPVYPLRFDKDYESLKRDLTAQGRNYLDLTIPPQSHRHLLGRTLDVPPHDVDSQVMIDTSMALSRVPEWRLESSTVNREQLTKGDMRETYIMPHSHQDKFSEGARGGDFAFKDHLIDDLIVNHFMQQSQHMLTRRKAADLEEEDLMLLPHDLYGFILRNRQWVTLRIADLSKVDFPNSFKDLMLPERHKSSIQALVQVHENTAPRTGNAAPTVGSSIDLVKGKGAGLILLLHGEPGVGKTSTAECVADHTKRPLFPITCGDIGETATEVEQNLHYNFRMAHKWGCVLLLDEADVFLAKRNKTDLRRNAVTSVFLRSLEYYAGILFLTTNRVGSIDPAFKSRIHMSLFYPKFDLEATLKLYSTYIERTREQQDQLESNTFKIKDKEILKFARRHFRQNEKEGLGTWNGRQIRNAFQAAIALVEYDSQQRKEGEPRPTLGEAQFNIVADSSREFDRYLVSTLGAGDSDIARQEQWRFDRFGNPEPKQPVMPQSYTSRNRGFYSGKNVETAAVGDDETSSDDDDDDDDGGNSSDDASIIPQRSRKKSRAGERDDDKEREQAEEYQEFRKWKNARMSGKGRY